MIEMKSKHKRVWIFFFLCLMNELRRYLNGRGIAQVSNYDFTRHL